MCTGLYETLVMLGLHSAVFLVLHSWLELAKPSKSSTAFPHINVAQLCTMTSCAASCGASTSGRVQGGRSAAPLFASSSRRRPRAQQHHHLGRLQVQAAAAQEVEETEDAKIAKLLAKPYKYGFKTIIESDVFPKGLDEDVVRAISAKKEEPDWMLEFRCRRCRRLGLPPPLLRSRCAWHILGVTTC